MSVYSPRSSVRCIQWSPCPRKQIDRVSRAFLRFPGEEDEACQRSWGYDACLPFHVTSRLRGRFSPDVYAQLMCLQHGTNHLDEIWEFLLSNRYSNLTGEGIDLEPIVWARLLHPLPTIWSG